MLSMPSAPRTPLRMSRSATPGAAVTASLFPVDNTGKFDDAVAMSPTEFEFIFVTDEVVDPADERIDAAMSHLDIVVESHNGLTLATVAATGVDAKSAGISAARILRDCGFQVERTYPDLVTRQDIADRIGMSRQAVGNWVRGDRHEADPFPTPTTLVAGGAWLWSEVIGWLTRNTSHREEVGYPTHFDHIGVDTYLATALEADKAPSEPASIHVRFARVSEGLVFAPATTRSALHWGAADSSQHDYSLAS